MTGSPYPPGVLGTEDAITGPVFQHDGEEYCRNCDDFREGIVTGWSDEVEFECAICGRTELIEDYSDLLDCEDEDSWAVGGC